ncbi:hypothetical protein V2J09_019914 [Rumex salicifolius]
MAAVAVAVAGIFNLHPSPPPRYRFTIFASINQSRCTNHSPSPNSVQLNNTLSEIQNSGYIACLRAPWRQENHNTCIYMKKIRSGGRFFSCKAQSSGSSRDTVVYKGAYGSWTILPSDVREVKAFIKIWTLAINLDRGSVELCSKMEVIDQITSSSLIRMLARKKKKITAKSKKQKAKRNLQAKKSKGVREERKKEEKERKDRGGVRERRKEREKKNQNIQTLPSIISTNK